MITADVDGNGVDEAVVDFGSMGLWRWQAGAWTQISPDDPEEMTAADVRPSITAARNIVISVSGLRSRAQDGRAEVDDDFTWLTRGHVGGGHLFRIIRRYLSPGSRLPPPQTH